LSGTNITNLEVYQNISVRAACPDLDGGAPFAFCDYNLFFDGAAGSGGTHNLTADPQFVGPTLTDPAHFKLDAGSPALGAGRAGENLGAYASAGQTETIGRG